MQNVRFHRLHRRGLVSAASCQKDFQTALNVVNGLRGRTLYGGIPPRASYNPKYSERPKARALKFLIAGTAYMLTDHNLMLIISAKQRDPYFAKALEKDTLNLGDVSLSMDTANWLFEQLTPLTTHTSDIRP